MKLDAIYLEYLCAHRRGVLVTVGAGGNPQVKPVGYRFSKELAAIEIAGYAMERSAKYRNVATEPRVAFLVEDTVGDGPAGLRFLEVRGRAEQAVVEPTGQEEQGLSREVIRIHPRRLVAWNLDPAHPGLHTVDLEDEDTAQSPEHPERRGREPADRRPVLDLGDGAAWEAADAAKALADELQAGFDARDADVSNRHFAADIVWGSPFGATVHGYDELHAIHQRLKQQGRGGSDSRFELVKVLAPAPGVAVAQIRRLALDENGRPVTPDGDLTGPFSELAMYVLVRRGRTWWLAAGQNTPALPPPE